MITQNIHVRMDAYGIPPVIHAVEGDTWRYLDIYTDDAAINTSNTAVVAIHRPDDSYYTISATPNVGGFYHLEMDQALTRPGKVECQLKVSSGDLVISTYTFYVIVEPSTTGLPTEQLGYDIYDLIDAAQQIQNVGLTDDIKQALLTCFDHVAWTDEHGQDYVDALEAALYPPAELVSISAVYTQSGTVYTTDSLNDLKNDLVVTAIYTDSTTETVTTYTLSGTLTEGTSVITVAYEGKTTTFNVTVTAPATLSSITAVYTQSGTVYDTDSLDSLKTDLVVTAVYSDSTTQAVASTDYTLSGTLTEGTSTITVSYGGKTTTFTVTVSHVDNSIINWDFRQSLVDSKQGLTATLNGNATQDSSGLHINANNDYVVLGTILKEGQSYEIDVANMDVSTWTQNTGRIFIWYTSNGSGIAYDASNNRWTIYDGTWQVPETDYSAKDLFANSTIRVTVGAGTSQYRRLVTVYKDGVALFSANTNRDIVTASNNAWIGNINTSAFKMTITGFRVYSEA